MRTRRLVVVLALLAAACADDSGGGEPEGGPATGSEPAASATAAETTTTLRPPVPTDPPPLPDETIGDLVIPCAPVDASPQPDVVGVTDSSIVIGTGSDRGGIATPGAGRGIVEMIEVLADHCNANGGLFGRDIHVVEYDAAAAEAADRVREACDEVVALVGHSFLQLVEEVLTALDCGVARYPAGAGLVPSTPIHLHGHLTAAIADPAAAQIALLGPDTPTAATERARHRAAIDAIGGPLAVVADLAYPIDRQPDWDRLVGEARFAGAGQVHIVGGCDHAVLPFLDIATGAGWSPMIVATAGAYDPACLDAATPDRLLIEVPFLPFEDGDDAPAAAEHVELLDRIAAPRTGYALLAASAFWRWATDARACLGDVDPACAAAHRETTDDEAGWTAGGLHPPVAADGTTEGCAVVLGVEDGAFVRRFPADAGTYACDAAFSALPPAPASAEPDPDASGTG